MYARVEGSPGEQFEIEIWEDDTTDIDILGDDYIETSIITIGSGGCGTAIWTAAWQANFGVSTPSPSSASAQALTVFGTDSNSLDRARYSALDHVAAQPVNIEPIIAEALEQRITMTATDRAIAAYEPSWSILSRDAKARRVYSQSNAPEALDRYFEHLNSVIPSIQPSQEGESGAMYFSRIRVQSEDPVGEFAPFEMMIDEMTMDKMTADGELAEWS